MSQSDTVDHAQLFATVSGLSGRSHELGGRRSRGTEVITTVEGTRGERVATNFVVARRPCIAYLVRSR